MPHLLVFILYLKANYERNKEITVDCVDQFIFVISWYVVGGLIDGVHQDGGQVHHHEDAQKVPVI